MKRVLIPGVILCGADVAQAVDDKNMYMHVFEEMTVYAPVPVPVNGNTQYISEYSDYKQYVDEKLDSSLTWDTRLSWTPQFLKQQNLTISADILNVLDSKTAVDTTNTGVATYASGRTFWLDVSMKF